MQHTYACSICKKNKNKEDFKILKFNSNEVISKKCINCEEEQVIKRIQCNKNSIARCRVRLYNMMGGCCVCCGMSEWWNLTIISIYGKRENGRIILYNLLKNPNNQKDFQIICHGCNYSKGTGKKCTLEHDMSKLMDF